MSQVGKGLCWQMSFLWLSQLGHQAYFLQLELSWMAKAGWVANIIGWQMSWLANVIGWQMSRLANVKSAYDAAGESLVGIFLVGI